MDIGAFGKRLARLMVAHDLTQGELAHRTKRFGYHVTQSYISRLLVGERVPSLAVALALSRALDVSLDWLATGETHDPEELTPEEEDLLFRFRRITDTTIREILLGIAHRATTDV